MKLGFNSTNGATKAGITHEASIYLQSHAFKFHSWVDSEDTRIQLKETINIEDCSSMLNGECEKRFLVQLF